MSDGDSKGTSVDDTLSPKQASADAATEIKELQKDAAILEKHVQDALALPIWGTAKNLQLYKETTRRKDLCLPEVDTLELYQDVAKIFLDSAEQRKRPLGMALLGMTLAKRITEADRKGSNVMELVFQFATKASKVYSQSTP